MEIQEFLELCSGKWFSQRTSYHLEQQKAENSKSELIIERLAPDHSEVVKLCQQYRINPDSSLGGEKVSWDNSVDWGQPKQVGSAIIVLVPDAENPQLGKLLRTGGNSPKPAKEGRYILRDDEALTLMLQEDSTYLEERLTFASNNLRLRTILIKQADGSNKMAFYSEIRKMPTPPKPES